MTRVYILETAGFADEITAIDTDSGDRVPVEAGERFVRAEEAASMQTLIADAHMYLRSSYENIKRHGEAETPWADGLKKMVAATRPGFEKEMGYEPDIF